MNSVSKQVVTGATGFVGGFLAQEMFERGERPIFLARDGNSKSAKERIVKHFSNFENCQVVAADITKPNLGIERTESKCFRNVDTIWHCAALSQFNSDNSRILASNTLGTRNVLEFARRIGARRFHYVSSAYVCGDRQGVIREDELEVGQTFKNTYEQSKFRAEWLVKDFSCKFGLHATIYRPSIVIGSSLTGQTTSFTGYNYLAKVFYRQKQFILRELVKNPEKLAGSGISRTASGVILPARIPCSADATVNLVTIDHVIETMLKLADRPGSIGKTLHITNSKPPNGRKLFTLSGEVLGVEGLCFVDSVDDLESNNQNNILDNYESRIREKIAPYIPYLQDDLQFDDSNVRRVLGDAYKSAPKVNKQLLQKLFDYATRVNWKSS